MLDDICWTVGDGLASLDEVCALFDRVFAEQPYGWGQLQSQRHRTALVTRAGQPGFRSVVARAANRVVGAAYGFPADDLWWAGVVPPDAAESDAFTVSGIAVAEQWRRYGLGRRMLDRLLADCDKSQAVVAVLPNAVVAQHFYARLGWRLVGRKNLSANSPIDHLKIYSTPALSR